LQTFTIAIDGPGGAGKSTVADNLAKKLAVPHLDTGAMYRAFGYRALQEGLSASDPAAMAALAERIRMDVRFIDGRQHTYVNGEDVTGLIRTPEAGMAASDCGTLGPVRKRMVAMQQAIAARQSIILDGRDIGTRVLPDATLKIFLTASAQVRAERRHREMLDKGQPSDYDAVLRDVITRDRQDSTRAIDPLRAAEDAVTLDTSAMTQEQVEDAVLKLLEQKLKRKRGKPLERFTFTYRLAIALSAFVFNLILPVRYHNLERTDLDAPYILIGNHNHMLDPFAVGWKVKRYQIRFLGKRELIHNPLMKVLYLSTRMIPVGRHDTDMGALRACLNTLKENHVLGIFPEGTRYKKTLMEELESGVAMIALRGGVPLLPVYMTGKMRLFHRTDCYYGEPFSVASIAEKGVNRETCREVLSLITALYRDMARAHEAAGREKEDV
jgi:cytidylate kinase